jgi:hypothetical protein
MPLKGTFTFSFCSCPFSFLIVCFNPEIQFADNFAGGNVSLSEKGTFEIFFFSSLMDDTPSFT